VLCGENSGMMLEWLERMFDFECECVGGSDWDWDCWVVGLDVGRLILGD